MVVDRRRVIWIAAPIAAVILLLVLAQLTLPGIAENRVEDEVSDGGTVESVSVSAFPAVKLLWGKADEVDVRMSEYRASGTDRIAELIERTRDVGEVDATMDTVRVGPLTMHGVRFHAEDGEASASASVSDGEIQAAVPSGLGLKPVAAESDGIVFEASVGAFGLQATQRARVAAQDGAIVVTAEGGLGSLLGDAAALTVFSDPRVSITNIGAQRAGNGYTVSANGLLPG